MLSECPTRINTYFLAQKYNSVTLNRRTDRVTVVAQKTLMWTLHGFCAETQQQGRESTQHTLHTAGSTYKAQYIP